MGESISINNGAQPQRRLGTTLPLHNGGQLPPVPVVLPQAPVVPRPPPQMGQQVQRPIPQALARSLKEPPHPSSDVILPQVGRIVEISDLRSQSLTEDGYRELLTDYIPIRFEKVQPFDEYDYDGEEVRPSWANCTRRRLPNVDNAECRREIRRLNKEDNKKGRTLMEKQNNLSTMQQEQLAKAVRDLSAEEQDRRFHIILVQFDCTLKPVVIEKHERTSRSHSKPKHKRREKPKYERSSITAYFKRCPRPDEIASELMHRLEVEKHQHQERQESQRREREMAEIRARQEQALQMQQQQINQTRPRPMPQHPTVQQTRPSPPAGLNQGIPKKSIVVPMAPPGSHAQNKPNVNIVGPVAPPKRPAIQMAPPGSHVQRQPNGNIVGSIPPPKRPATPIRVIHKPNERRKNQRGDHDNSAYSSDSSDESVFTDSESDSNSEQDSESTFVTIPSHSSNFRNHGKKNRRQERSQHKQRQRQPCFLEEPENFGVQPRRHKLRGAAPAYILTASDQRVPVAPLPPRPADAIPVDNLVQMRADAYRAGRADQKYQDQQLVGKAESLDLQTRRYVPRNAPRPEIFQEMGNSLSRDRDIRMMRHVTQSEVGRQLGDSFARFRNGRESPRFYDNLENVIYRRDQRQREASAMEEHDAILRAIEEEERDRRRQRSPVLNPFTPLSRDRTGGAYGFTRVVDREYR